MKNYLYHFEFFSGFYESYFYQQVRAKNEKDAIIQIISFFKNLAEEDVEVLLINELGKRWSVRRFWDEMDLDFSNDTEGYKLSWIKEIDFDLDDIGKDI